MELSKTAIKALETQFNGIYQTAVSGTPVWWDKLAMLVPSSTATNTYGWLAALMRMRKWVGPRVIQNVKHQAYVVTNDDFELTVGVDRNDIKDDNLGIYTPLFAQLGFVSSKLPDDQIKTALQAGTTNVGFDNVAQFATTHPLDPTGNQSNNFTGTALSTTNFAAKRAAMRAYTGENGQNLGVEPDLLIVPPQLEDTANTIVTAEYGSSGASNVQKGQARVLVINELANEGTTWYLADSTKPIKGLVWQEREPVQMVAKTDVNDDNVFMHKQFLWGLDGRGAATYGPWFLIARAIA
jgi:phage major head subunit gpT-like protein